MAFPRSVVFRPGFAADSATGTQTGGAGVYKSPLAYVASQKRYTYTTQYNKKRRALFTMATGTPGALFDGRALTRPANANSSADSELQRGRDVPLTPGRTTPTAHKTHTKGHLPFSPGSIEKTKGSAGFSDAPSPTAGRPPAISKEAAVKKMHLVIF